MSENVTATPATPLPPIPPLTDLPHDSRQANIIVCSAACLAISAFFVVLRFYTRGFVIRVLGSTDWSILLALIFSAATTVSLIEQAVLGSGHHVWDLDPTDIDSGISWGRSAWMGILFYALSLCFSKVSILLLYIHLFAFNWARRAGQILLGIVVISNVYMFITTCTACIPLQSYWDFTMEKKYCHPQALWWSHTSLHMVTDFLIFLIPMPVVWTILLPKKQKLMLFGVFGLGFIVCFISILRLLQLIQVENHPNPDFTWAAVELSYLTAVEINGAIVVACVMTLKPLIVKYFPGFLISRHGGSSSSYSPSGGGGPPTIGSRPSKAPISPVDSELVSKYRGGDVAESGGFGYGELAEDSWRVDVEVAGGGGGSGMRRDMDGEGEREREKGGGMVEKKGSLRSMGSGESITVTEDEERPPPVPDKTGVDVLRGHRVGG